MSRLAKFRELNWPERRQFALALALLPAVALGLRLFGFRRTQAALASAGFKRAASEDGALPQARTTARLVVAAARHGPYRANCLPVSLTLQWLLRRQGIQTALRLGVSKASTRLDAHAWVEHQGTPLIDSQYIGERFAAFDKAISPATTAPK